MSGPMKGAPRDESFANTSVGKIEHSCDMLQRGDILLPFTERPAPPIKSEAHFERSRRQTASPWR